MRIAINAISATAGGARTYLLNLARMLPDLARHEYQLFIPSAAAADLGNLPANVHLVQNRWAERSYAARLFWEQCWLPNQVRRWGADALLCVGNFCPLRCPVPVVLLSRNPLYFTPHFLEDLLDRRHYLWAIRHVAMTRLALWSASSAKVTITPTAAMADMIRATAKQPLALRAIHHGFQLWPGISQGNGAEASSPSPASPFRFLLVSHYNYFRNFETVLHALAEMRRRYGDGRFRLLMTTTLRPGLHLGGYDTTRAYGLMERLSLKDTVTSLGPVAYDELPRLYRSVHAVICPAYTESFSHTVVEAMAMGVPVIASDIPVHREVAGDAALFFSPLEPAHLAEQCRKLMEDQALRVRLESAGRQKAQCYSWRRHFESLLAVIGEATAGRQRNAVRPDPRRGQSN